MAYDERLAERVRASLAHQDVKFEERKMFGGIAFMVRGRMVLGVTRDSLMVRTGPDAYERALAQSHVRLMDFTGRPMKGMVMVDAAGVARAPSVARWVKLALAHNATEAAKRPPRKR